jgi:anti-sigma factor RsiW
MAFADGELTGAERAEVEAALEQDQALRERLEAHHQIRARLSSAFDGALSEPVPQRLTDAAQTPRQAEVIDFATRRAAKWSVREWGAMAASVALGLVVGVGATQQNQPMIATAESGMIARGALSHALDTQLASNEAGAVRIGVSFRNHDGEYCRTFDLTEGGASGLACRDNNHWSIPLMSGSAAGGEVRTAGASTEVLNAVDAMI